jgi:hypothetical protein
MAVVKGNDAVIKIGTTDATTWALSNFSLNFDRGTVEQELVGQEGNYYVPGSLSMDGSLTNCRFAASGNSPFLDSIVEGAVILISGCIGTDLLKFYLNSCQVTGYDVSIGDAATITEASIDFTVMNPKDITFEGTKVSG